jgi:hypothetical protein
MNQAMADQPLSFCCLDMFDWGYGWPAGLFSDEFV